MSSLNFQLSVFYFLRYGHKRSAKNFLEVLHIQHCFQIFLLLQNFYTHQFQQQAGQNQYSWEKNQTTDDCFGMSYHYCPEKDLFESDVQRGDTDIIWICETIRMRGCKLIREWKTAEHEQEALTWCPDDKGKGGRLKQLGGD